VRAFGERLGIELEAAALGIVELVVNNMARSIRVVTVERGLDPRDFALVAFGGAGPLLAAELAEVLGMRRIVVPLVPGVTSALGCLHVEITHDVGESFIVPLAGADARKIAGRFDALSKEILSRLADDGVPAGEALLEHGVDLRYLGQVRALTIGLEPSLLEGAFVGELLERFYSEYERRFHFATREIEVEVCALRVRGRRRPQHREPQVTLGGGAPVTSERTVVTRSGQAKARVIERSSVAAGTRLPGPLVLTQADSTSWVPPGWNAEVDRHGNLLLEREAGPDAAAPA
jgi:N-methylhydantoinase A